jgi:hypothetical protein
MGIEVTCEQGEVVEDGVCDGMYEAHVEDADVDDEDDDESSCRLGFTGISLVSDMISLEAITVLSRALTETATGTAVVAPSGYLRWTKSKAFLTIDGSGAASSKRQMLIAVITSSPQGTNPAVSEYIDGKEDRDSVQGTWTLINA